MKIPTFEEEKNYLKNNPGKHKMNLFCSSFYQLVAVNGKKFKDYPDLDKCVKFDKTFIESTDIKLLESMVV